MPKPSTQSRRTLQSEHAAKPRQAMVWFLRAILTWIAAWIAFWILSKLSAPLWVALTLGTGVGVAASQSEDTLWRSAIIAAGFPLSLALSGMAAAYPAWIWLLPLAALALLYPMNTWRDAPLFPTPAGVLDGLADVAPLPPQARIMDAGCGLGAGLRELRRVYPVAELVGLEWSWPLRAACAVRCPFASVRRADIWREDWSGYDLVYIFQRPESMPSAAAKARAELGAGSWLVSLEFEATTLTPFAVLKNRADKPVWVYRMSAGAPKR